MLRNARVLALGLALGSPSCNDSFECAADSHCELDGVAGFCESIGHCSFPDEGCDSGRRFGGLAGTLSNQCVPPTEDESGSSDVSSGSSSETSTTAIPTSDSASTSVGETSESSNVTLADTGTSSTGGEVLPCTVLYEDSFVGDAIDPTWLVVGDPVVSGGAARFTINPEDAGTYDLLVALGGTMLDLSEGSVTLEVESVPQVLRTQGTLTLGAPDAQVFLLWEAGGVRPVVEGMDVDHSLMMLPWVRIAFTVGEGGTPKVVFSQSVDGIEWTEAASAPITDFDASNVAVELTAGSYDAFAIPQEFAIASISICGDPGGLERRPV